MKIAQEKLESIGFNSKLHISSVEDPMVRNRVISSRILSGSFSFNNVTKQGYANYVKIDKSLLNEFNQDFVGGLEVIEDKGSKFITIGKKGVQEFLEIEII